jgi:hypothetical protein
VLTIALSCSLAAAIEWSKVNVYRPMPAPKEFRILPINPNPRIVELPKKDKHEVPSTAPVSRR